jgi:transcriptional regulator with XRE-family HTH domain
MSKIAARTPHPVDVYVGRKLRMRRTILGMSQSELGDAIGISFQQVQKYERGANRISASKLWDFSRALDVTPAYFFDGFSADEGVEQ